MSHFDTWFNADHRVNSLPPTTRDQIKDLLHHTFNEGRRCEASRPKAKKEKPNG